MHTAIVRHLRTRRRISSAPISAQRCEMRLEPILRSIAVKSRYADCVSARRKSEFDVLSAVAPGVRGHTVDCDPMQGRTNRRVHLVYPPTTT
jgi:hypothetical protein